MEFCSAHPSVVRSVKQRDLLNVWQRLAPAGGAAAPSEAQFRPARFEEEKPDLVYYRILWEADNPCIIINSDGSRVATAYGNGVNNKGRLLEEYLGPTTAAEVMPIYNECIRRARPVFTKSTVYDILGHRVYYERLLLPFSEGNAVTSIIASLKWISGDGSFEIRNLFRSPDHKPELEILALIDEAGLAGPLPGLDPATDFFEV